MKFKKDGKVFEDIEKLRQEYCVGRGCQRDSCRLASHRYVCDLWVKENPAEAARLMGYEVVEEEKEANMDKQSKSCTPVETSDNIGQKPRICEVLGVEMGERFAVKDKEAGFDSVPLFVDEFGEVRSTQSSAKLPPALLAIHAINHPESIIRKPRFTEEEVEMAKAAKVLWPHAACAKKEIGAVMLYGSDGIAIAGIDPDAFPSILPGTNVKLSDIVGGTS